MTSLYITFAALALIGIVGATFAWMAFRAAANAPSRRRKLQVFEVVFESSQKAGGGTKSVGQLVTHGWEPSEPWKP